MQYPSYFNIVLLCYAYVYILASIYTWKMQKIMEMYKSTHTIFPQSTQHNYCIYPFRLGNFYVIRNAFLYLFEWHYNNQLHIHTTEIHRHTYMHITSRQECLYHCKTDHYKLTGILHFKAIHYIFLS